MTLLLMPKPWRVGAKCIQIHTGGMCHLDADMTRQGINELGADGLELVVLENVGNLVCPAEFDTGAVKNVTILSVPEGHDKPLKYPLMYEVCDLLIVNKIDVLPYFDFDVKKVVEYVKNAILILISFSYPQKQEKVLTILLIG